MRNALALCFLFVCLHTYAALPQNISSPKGKLSIKIDMESNPAFIQLFEAGEQISQLSVLDFVFQEGELSGGWVVENSEQKSVDTQWSPVYGERMLIKDTYNQLKLSLIAKNTKKRIDLLIRLYDEGLALKYCFNPSDFDQSVLVEEKTVFGFEYNGRAWVTGAAQGLYKDIRMSKIEGEVERPLVVNLENKRYLGMGEAALVDFARMKFKNASVDNRYQVQSALSGKVDLKQAGFESPWRYIMVGRSAGELLENNDFVLNLNEPCRIKDTSWIRPGKVLREVTLTTQGGIACVDFAARNNIDYVEFDAGWYGLEYSKESDARAVNLDTLRSKGPLDLHYIIDYAAKKGVGIILYVNMNALEKQLDELLPLYKSWGVKGMKFGFVNVGSQQWTSWLHEAVRKAADHQLMVDIHDEYRPTGYSRTYPNLMTQEGIRGDEESPSVQQTLATLFTRMIAGAGDYTNCFYAARVHEKMGGKAAQMAKAVLMYSPWQFVYWYDRPEASPRRALGAGGAESIIVEDETSSFYKNLPVVWDETRVLESSIGERAVVARRAGDKWYIALLNASARKQFDVKLNFLDNTQSYRIQVYNQDVDDLLNNRVDIKEYISNGSILSILLESGSGAVLCLESIF